MAAPLAHIFLAVLMLAGPFKNLFNEKEFLVGTSFPDIRYISASIGRSATHVKNVKLMDILQETNSFRAGLLFHSFVDEKREAYVVHHNLYAQLPSFKFVSHALKFAEDQLLQTFFDASCYASFFNDILPEERGYGVPEEDIQRWHAFLRGYISKKPSPKDLLMSYFDLYYPQAWQLMRWIYSWSYAHKIEQTIAIVLKDKKSRGLLLDFYKNFVTLYSNA